MPVNLDLPQDSIAEITLIGTGGGYGESCVVHLGENEWIVVDSCANPQTDECLPLNYLLEIGVQVATQVKLIVCTHWHDDHIRGISRLFEHCKEANLCFARPTDLTKFLYLVNLDYEKAQFGDSISSTTEFIKCIEIAKFRKTTLIKAAAADRILLSNNSNDIERFVASLSPSDLTIDMFSDEISKLITEYGEPNKKIIAQSPNDKSIALYLKFGEYYAVLGADLEVGIEAKKGWLDILNNSQLIKNKSSLFKIPHHGSENGYHERLWLELLDDNPVAKLTPWNRNGKLPDPNMLNVFCGHSDKVFMTSPIINQKPKKRDKNVEKLLQHFNVKLNEVKFSKGMIRCRLDFTAQQSKWQIDLFDEALHVNVAIDN